MWRISSQTDFVPFLTDFVPFLRDFVPHRFRPTQISSHTDFLPHRFRPTQISSYTVFVPHNFRPILNRFRPILHRFRPILDRFGPGLWEIILCDTQNEALIDIIYSVILHSVLLQPICMELDFFLKRLTYLLYGSVASLPSPSKRNITLAKTIYRFFYLKNRNRATLYFLMYYQPLWQNTYFYKITRLRNEHIVVYKHY